MEIPTYVSTLEEGNIVKEKRRRDLPFQYNATFLFLTVGSLFSRTFWVLPVSENSTRSSYPSNTGSLGKDFSLLSTLCITILKKPDVKPTEHKLNPDPFNMHHPVTFIHHQCCLPLSSSKAFLHPEGNPSSLSTFSLPRQPPAPFLSLWMELLKNTPIYSISSGLVAAN